MSEFKLVKRELLEDLLDSARLEADQRVASYGEDYRPHVLVTLRKMIADAEAVLAQEACTSCDGSGDCTDATGEWRGYCSCPAGVELKNRPAQEAGHVEEPLGMVEAVAVVRSSALGCIDWLSWPKDFPNGTKLYTSPPAPVAAPDGWKLVPIEPTELMIHRGDQNYSWSVAKIYSAMIADAPACLDKVKELN